MRTLTEIRWLSMYLYLWKLEQKLVYSCFLRQIFCLQLSEILFLYRLRICFLDFIYQQSEIIKVFMGIGTIRITRKRKGFPVRNLPFIVMMMCSELIDRNELTYTAPYGSGGGKWIYVSLPQ